MEDHLIIARTASVKFFTRFTDALRQSRLNVHVYIFQRSRPGKITTFNIQLDCAQAVDNGLAFLRCEHTDMGKHTGMCNRPRDIVAVQTSIKIDRCTEGLHKSIGGFGKPAGPGFVLLFTHM